MTKLDELIPDDFVFIDHDARIPGGHTPRGFNGGLLKAAIRNEIDEHIKAAMDQFGMMPDLKEP